MATVVIIHAAEDALPARSLAEKLRQGKLQVQLELPPGEQLREAVRGANAVMALWSPRSVEQSAVIDEVAHARSKGVIHARMQNAANPEQFRNDKSIDLTGWRGEDEFPGWRELAKAITSKAGVPNIPPPAPRPPSGFFQPGIASPETLATTQSPRRAASPPPRQQAQSRSQSSTSSAPRRAPAAAASEPKKGGGGMMIAVIVFLVVAGLAGGGYFVWNNMQTAKAQTSAWDDLDKNDAAALRTFIGANPGAHATEAQQALAHLEEESFDAAKDADSIDAFQGFLRDFPQSAHALEARGRIAELRAQPAPTTDTTTSTTAPADPDLLPPTATTTATTAPAPTTGGPVPLSPAPSTTTTTP